MGRIPSEILYHPTDPTKLPEAESLFGTGWNLDVLNSSVFTSSPATKSTMNATSFSAMKRPFENSHKFWTETSTEWDIRSPENVELDELDGIFDDFLFRDEMSDEMSASVFDSLYLPLTSIFSWCLYHTVYCSLIET